MTILESSSSPGLIRKVTNASSAAARSAALPPNYQNVLSSNESANLAFRCSSVSLPDDNNSSSSAGQMSNQLQNQLIADASATSTSEWKVALSKRSRRNQQHQRSLNASTSSSSNLSNAAKKGSNQVDKRSNNSIKTESLLKSNSDGSIFSVPVLKHGVQESKTNDSASNLIPESSERFNALSSAPDQPQSDAIIEPVNSSNGTSNNSQFLFELLHRLTEELLFLGTMSPQIHTDLYQFYQRELLVLEQLMSEKSQMAQEALKWTNGPHVTQSKTTNERQAKEKDNERVKVVVEESVKTVVIEENSLNTSLSSIPAPVVTQAIENPLVPIAKPLWSDKKLTCTAKPLAPYTKESFQLKQAKAQQLRVKLRTEKAEKLRSLSDKIKAVSERQEILRAQAQATIEKKLEKAERLRDSFLQGKKEKASKDSHQKPKLAKRAELDSSESNRKKSSLIKRLEISEVRLQEIEEERKRKQEESAAKEEAAMERRKALEAERIVKLQSLQEREKVIEAKRFQRKQEELAAKEAHKEEKAKRLKALKHEKEAGQEEKRKEIEEKLEKGTRLHGAQIELIKEKAAAVAERSREVKNRVKKPGMRRCRVCDLYIKKGPLWLAHLDEESHALMVKERNNVDEVEAEDSDEDNNPESSDHSKGVIVQVILNNFKRMKKSLKKHRQKWLSVLKPAHLDAGLLQTRASFFANNSGASNFINQCRECLKSPKKFNETRIEASFEEYLRMLNGARRKAAIKSTNSLVVSHPNDLVSILELVSLVDDHGAIRMTSSHSRIKLLSHVRTCISQDPKLSLVLLSHPNLPVFVLLDQLTRTLHYCTPIAFNHLQIASIQLQILSGLFNQLPKLVGNNLKGEANDNYLFIESLFGTLVTLDIVTYIHRTFLVIHGPLEADSPSLEFVKNAIKFLEVLSRMIIPTRESMAISSSSWTTSLAKTDLVIGIVTVLDAILLYSGPSSRAVFRLSEQISPELVEMSLYAVQALSNFAILDLGTFQGCLAGSSSPGLQTEFFHLVNFWLTLIISNFQATQPFSTTNVESMPNEIDKLFQGLVILLGYCCLDCRENKRLLRFGSSPVILQLLTYAPFKYFNEPKYINFLYPTLIIACYEEPDNTRILLDEMDPSHLIRYLKRNIKESSKSTPSQSPAANSDSDGCLEARFPKCQWTSALKYFETFEGAPPHE